MTRGVLYQAYGRPKYVAYCIWSIRLLRSTGYKGSICINTNYPSELMAKLTINLDVQINNLYADQYTYEKAFKIKTKMYFITPYEETLFLDVDTIIKGPINELWGYTGDLCLAEDIYHYEMIEAAVGGSGIGLETQHMINTYEKQPYLNTGVIKFKKTPTNEFIFSKWTDEWEMFKNTDEPAFNRLIRDNKVDVQIIPYKYNWLGHFLTMKPKEKEAIIYHPNGCNKLPLYAQMFGSEWLTLLDECRNKLK